ncbi:hypothetical protein CRE_15873 [Caenorhabditis remanei]|uniref:Uncharacterized protein n=1 Tax=Caenorhabditis remanei TaxID=31234 RepID=E3MBA0_CAERE|nr:hypothetical protein CRE_15873 [Caenorhabditis remanei]
MLFEWSSDSDGVLIRIDYSIPIYPILNHFYHSMIYQTISLICLFISLFLYFVSGQKDLNPLTLSIISLFCIFILSLFIRYLFVKVCVILLSILAIQRFVLYFYPTSENHWLTKKTCLRLLIYSLYCLVACEEYFYIIHHNVAGAADAYNTSLFNLHVVLAILLISSSMLYIPIYVSVRKLSHLMSSQLNKPHRFIFWQTVILTIGKVISLTPTLIHVSMGTSREIVRTKNKK